MAIVVGTNSGFVSSAPSSSPGGTLASLDGYCRATKATAPVGNYKVTEIGWWQDNTNNDSTDYTAGIYNHDAEHNRPNELIHTILTGNSTIANTQGWYKYTGLNISLNSGETYWIAFGAVGVTNDNAISWGDAIGYTYSRYSDAGGVIDSPWPASNEYGDRALAVYALYEAVQVNHPRIGNILYFF